jgi:hypothetical protein
MMNTDSLTLGNISTDTEASLVNSSLVLNLPELETSIREEVKAQEQSLPETSTNATRNTPSGDGTSNVQAAGTSTSPTIVGGDDQPGSNACEAKDTSSQCKGNIIYKLACTDQENPNKETFRYSWNPFEGLARDQTEDKARQERAVIDVIDRISGFALKERKSQHRHNFGTLEDTDPTPYIVGVDFFSRTKPTTYIRILSPHLLDVIRSLVLYYPKYELQSKEHLIEYPFRIIFHYWDELKQISEAFCKGEASITIKNPETGSEVTIICNKNTYDHLDVLYDCPPIRKVLLDVVTPERLLYKSKGLATYNNLWLLFRPGDIVFTRVRSKLAGFVVETVSHKSAISSPSPEEYPRTDDRWELKLWNLSYKSRKIVRESYTFFINRYHGERAILDLPVFPTTFMHDHDAVKNDLIERGRHYYRIICDEQSHMRYNGLVISEKPYFVSTVLFNLFSE